MPGSRKLAACPYAHPNNTKHLLLMNALDSILERPIVCARIRIPLPPPIQMPASHPFHRLFILLLAVVTVGFLPGLANSHERNNIRIYGRILDEAGAPLSETWVVTKGSRRGGVLVDA